MYISILDAGCLFLRRMVFSCKQSIGCDCLTNASGWTKMYNKLHRMERGIRRYGSFVICGVFIISLILYLKIHIQHRYLFIDDGMLHNSSIEIKPIDITRCNFGMYLRELCLECDVPVIRIEYLKKCEGIIYNRVPKCASETMGARLRKASKVNKYTYYWLINYNHTLTKDTVQGYVDKITKQDRFVLVGHHFLVNFTQYINDTLLYINLIREPVSWFISSYFYYKTQSIGYKGLWWNQRPMVECIADPECFNFIIHKFGAVRFLCGVSPVCNEPQSDGAVQLAKRNVDQTYLLVGITEEIDMFTQLLEYFLPHMFSNITRTQLPTKLHVTKQKGNVTEKTKSSLARLLGHEIELYQHVKQRFYKIHQAILPKLFPVKSTSRYMP